MYTVLLWLWYSADLIGLGALDLDSEKLPSTSNRNIRSEIHQYIREAIVNFVQQFHFICGILVAVGMRRDDQHQLLKGRKPPVRQVPLLRYTRGPFKNRRAVVGVDDESLQCRREELGELDALGGRAVVCGLAPEDAVNVKGLEGCELGEVQRVEGVLDLVIWPAGSDFHVFEGAARRLQRLQPICVVPVVALEEVAPAPEFRLQGEPLEIPAMAQYPVEDTCLSAHFVEDDGFVALADAEVG